MRIFALAGGVLLASFAGVAAQAQSSSQSLAQATRAEILLAPAVTGAARVSTGKVTKRSDMMATRSGLADRNVTTVSRKGRGKAIDTLTVTTAAPLRRPGYSPLTPPTARPDSDRDVTYVREWRNAGTVSAGRYDVAISPQAGLGFGSVGGSAQAGAVVVVSPAERDARLVAKLKKMGVVEGAAVYDEDTGRWYLFAAAKGRAVGLSMADGDRAWSTDPVALATEAQAGVGWRKGDIQASVGYSRRDMRTRDTYLNMIAPSRDEMVGISLSFRPGS